MTTEPSLERLEQLVGIWATELSHPALPGVVVQGTSVVEWLEGERFLIHRARTDHADFPDSISVIGFTGQDWVDDEPGGRGAPSAKPPLRMHYFDSRGVFRVYSAAIDDDAWRVWRDAPEFSQRFTGTFTGDRHTIAGRWQLSRDDVNWDDDLKITYRRTS